MPENKAQDDDLVINLLEMVLAQPADEREVYLRSACKGDCNLFDQVWHYVEWEQRMGEFLLDPLFPPPLEEHHFNPGELLEHRFQILREVAQGGMGIVYEALDQKLNRRIAIKCAKSGFGKRLPPEVRHATEISHPNVCKTYEIHTASTDHGEVDFLTMEFLEGETLADALRHERLPRQKALLIARQLCAGLAEAHRNQVIHGDLKANNVFLTAAPDGSTRAVITDFGLARCNDPTELSMLAEREIEGTPDYMAPELWKGETNSVLSDVYALGILLYELAAGHRPYAPDLSWEQRQSRKPPLVDPKWDPILARCLDPDPAKRFQSAEQVTRALEPSKSRIWYFGMTATAALAIATGVVTYQRTTTPKESVRLAVLPFESSVETTPLAAKLIGDAARQIAKLDPGKRVRLDSISPTQARLDKVDTPQQAGMVLKATHSLHGTLEQRNGKTLVHAYITDTKSGVHTKEWTAEYDPGETRYVPVALAGMVTETFRLPALTNAAAVNADAAQDYWAGLYYIRKNSTIDKAILLLEHAVSLDPDSPLTHAALAEAKYFKYTIDRDASWLQRSAESVRKAESRNPDLAQVHRVAGLHKRQAGWYEQAAADYRRAIELDPANADAYRRLGIVQEANSQSNEALASYLRSIELGPDDYRNQQALGSYYDQLADYTQAETHYRKAVQLAPQEPAVHFVLGRTYINLGRFDEAAAELDTSIARGETAVAVSARGEVLMYQGKDHEAIPYFTHALARWPQNYAYIWWANLGIAYRRIGDFPASRQANLKGLQFATAETTRNVRDGYVRSYKAYLLAALGEKSAVDEIAQALQESPQNADTRFNAVQTYEALGRHDDSIAVLSSSPIQVLADVSRFPDLADLRRDSRFQNLLASHQLK